MGHSNWNMGRGWPWEPHSPCLTEPGMHLNSCGRQPGVSDKWAQLSLESGEQCQTQLRIIIIIIINIIIIITIIIIIIVIVPMSSITYTHHLLRFKHEAATILHFHETSTVSQWQINLGKEVREGCLCSCSFHHAVPSSRFSGSRFIHLWIKSCGL